MTTVIVNFIQLLAMFLWFMLIIRVVMSWTNPRGGGQLIAFVYQMTEPFLAPIRRLLPQTSGIDWSPLIAMLVLGMIVRVVVRL
jgi:YggT family protein